MYYKVSNAISAISNVDDYGQSTRLLAATTLRLHVKYFPKVEKHGLPAFKTILQKVHEAYVDQRTKIIEQKR